jgi:hypothetical protein
VVLSLPDKRAFTPVFDGLWGGSARKRGMGRCRRQTHHLPTRPLAHARVHPGEGWHRPSGIIDSHFKQPGGQASALREIARHPAAVRPVPPRKQSRRVKRRKALVRKPPHPWPALRSGLSLHRKGRPAHDAGRRALRRFTAVISVRPRLTRSGRACVPARIAHRPLQQSSLRTGRYAHEAECPRRPECPVD